MEGKGLPLVRIRDVQRGYSETYFDGLYDEKYLVSDGDFLISMDGNFNLGQWQGGRALLNQRVCLIRDTSDEVDLRYLVAILPRYLAEIEARTPFVTVKHLSAKALNAIMIPIPDLQEQKRIADQYFLQKLIKQKRELQQELYTELERSLFVSIFGNPENWANKCEMTTIGGLAESTQYGTSAKAGATGEYPVLRMGNITDDGKLDLSDLKYMDLSPEEVEKYTVRKGDLLFNRTNSKEKVGKAAVVLTDEKLAYAGYLVRVRFKNPDHAHFVAAFLNSDYGRRLRRKLAKTAVNQANINAKELTKIPILEPENAKMIKFKNFITL